MVIYTKEAFGMGVDWGEYYGTEAPNEMSAMIDKGGMTTRIGRKTKKKTYSTEEAAAIGCVEAIEELDKKRELERERNMTPEKRRAEEERNERRRLTFYSSFPIMTMIDAVRDIEREISYEEQQALEDEIIEAIYQHNKHMEDILNRCKEIKRKAKMLDGELPF